MARAQQTTNMRTQAGATNRTTTAKKQAAQQAGATNRTMKKQAAAQTATTNRTAPAKRKTASKTGGKRTQTKREAMEGPGGRRLGLTPIRSHQSRTQILATVAADSGVDRPIVERVARSLSTTLTRHLVRGGSGRVEVPYLGAALWRGRQAAQKPRTMLSPILGNREVKLPGRRACAVPRLRVHTALREIVART